MDNPYSWTKAGVHLLFIDQPIGTGLSFMSANATYLTNEEETTAQLYSALVYFFTKLHPKFALVDFYISGESYAGKYIPRLTDYILARQSKRDTISHAFPLKGIIIGNGLTHPIVQRTAAVEQAYAASLIGLDQKLQLQSVIDGCKRRIASENWLAAVDYCESILKFVNVATGHSAGLEELDLYNYYELGPMYNRTQVEGYLNTVEFRQAVHITDDIVANPFHACNGDLAEALQPWILRSVLPLLPRILSKDVKVMFYGGNVDLKDGPIGTELFLTSAIGSSASIMSSWEGYQSFIDAPRRVWTVNSKIAGWIRSGGNLSFVTVRSAGHAVPKDQNVNSLEMIRRFLELSPSNQQFCEGYAGCLPRAEVGPVLCTALQNCSGHGSCNNDTGLCICDPEWSNADCSVQVQPLTLGMVRIKIAFYLALIIRALLTVRFTSL
jgi:vitellogenic carboxypeptidase-like protein